MLEIKNILKELGNFRLTGINLSVEKGDYFIVLGVSGAGKSLLLEVIAGLIKPDSGSIILDGEDITHTDIQHRKTGLVFQDYAVFPHLTVEENIRYPLKGKGFFKFKIEERVEHLAREMNITHLMKRSPGSLSGGELQRVALARTLALKPKVLLLDEPLASLDIQLRLGIRKLLKAIHRSGQTIIHVTHDYEEAISLADKIAVLNEGRILQTGAPEIIFEKPENEFIAHFVGYKNIFTAKVEEASTSNIVRLKIDNKFTVWAHNGNGQKKGLLLIPVEKIGISNLKPYPVPLNCHLASIIEILPAVNGFNIVVDAGVKLTALLSREEYKALELRENSKVWVYFEESDVRFVRHHQ